MRKTTMCALAATLLIAATPLRFSAAMAQNAAEWNCRGDTRDLDQQIEGCTRAIRSGQFRGKDLAWAYTNRGSVYDYKRDFDHAIADLTEAIRLDPDAVVAYQDRAASYRNTGKFDRAIDDLDQAARLDPNDARTFMSRGIIYFKVGAVARAILDFDTSLKIDPKFAPSLYGRGVAKLKDGDVDGGHADIDAAKAIQSSIGEVFVTYFGIASP
jgi:tetratricopeptide (TPR) repeat protein